MSLSNPSSSSAGPSTPMRAITTMLSSRSAPTIPPASQTYEPLVKAVLRHRLLYKIFPYSALFCWVSVVIISTWSQGGISRLGFLGALLNPLRPSTLMFALAMWLFSIVPVIVLRKTYLTASPTIATSPSKIFSTALGKRSTIRSLVVYVFSALLLTTIHVSMAYVHGAAQTSDLRLTVFVKSRKHPYYLNGHLLYLVSSQVALACMFLLRNIMLDRFAVKWDGLSGRNETRSPIPARVVALSITVIILTAACIAGHTVFFGFSRSIILPILYHLPVLPRLLRPFTAHFLKGPITPVLLVRNWSAVPRAFLLGLTTMANWEFAETLFDVLVAEPVAVAHTTADPPLTLVSGITTSDLYFKHFAYAELRHLATENSPTSSAHRTALFTDQKYSPSLWATLCREMLLTLGKDYQLLLRRGQPPPPAPAPAGPSKPTHPPPPSTPLIQKPILKQSPQHPLRSALDTLASDGPISAAVSSTAEAGASHIPDLFRSVRSVMPAAASLNSAVEKVKRGEEGVKEIREVGEALVSGRWKSALGRYEPGVVRGVRRRVGDWWTRERLGRVVECAVPNRKLDGLAIDTICGLVCASLTEDRYGVVQRDIPRILEALLSFLTAVEDYLREINERQPSLSPEDLRGLSAAEVKEREQMKEEVRRASDALSEVGDPLKEGVVKIVETFADKLGAFKFPPRIARKLQGFADYN